MSAVSTHNIPAPEVSSAVDTTKMQLFTPFFRSMPVNRKRWPGMKLSALSLNDISSAPDSSPARKEYRFSGSLSHSSTKVTTNLAC